MKKLQLIEYGIILCGLIFGYNFAMTFFYFISQVAFYLNDGSGPWSFGSVLSYLLLNLLFLAALFLLIRKSREVARFLCPDHQQDTISTKISKQSLLEVTLIAISVITIISNGPDILGYLFKSFRKSVRSGGDVSGYLTDVENMKLKSALVQAIMAAVLLFFHRQVSSWFIRKDEAEALIFDTETDNH